VQSVNEQRPVSDLFGKNIVVYDLEIKRPIDACSRGWESHDEMGISVGCAFDYRSMRYRVFMDDNIPELVVRLNEPGTLVVAFNHVGFDNKLLRASGHPLAPDDELRNYDMLLVSKAGAGAEKRFVKGFKLDEHLAALGLPLKTGDGAAAPLWWQEGKVGRVIDYCMNDVTQERALFEVMYADGQAACSYKRERYSVERPTWVEEVAHVV
jgi:hypothetical protein